MNALDNEVNSLGDSQESRKSSDGRADFSSGAGGAGFGLGYEIGDEGHETLRRISELYDKLHEVEFPAIAGILETNKQVQAITRSFSQSNSVCQLASLQKSLVTPEMTKALAFSQSVRQSVDAVWIDSVGKTLDQVFSNATFQSMNAFNKAVSANIAQVADAMSRYGRGIVDFDQFGIAASAALAPMLDSLKRMNIEFDWDGALRLHEMWGSYGWVVIDSMPAMGPKGSPSTWQEANRIARRYLKDGAVEDIRRKLRAIVRKRIDLEEAFLLYDEKRYKPCAMMLTSLIDCELYKKAKKPEKKDGSGQIVQHAEPGVSARILTLEEKTERIHHEVTPNHGGSIKDAVKRIEDRSNETAYKLAEATAKLDEHIVIAKKSDKAQEKLVEDVGKLKSKYAPES